MKLIDLYQMIANGELEEGTKIIIDGEEYIYKRGSLRELKYENVIYLVASELQKSLNTQVEIQKQKIKQKFEMKEMEYLDYQTIKNLDKKSTVLDSGNFFGYDYYIISYLTHPCAYVRIPADNPLYGKDFNSIDDIVDVVYPNLNVHGGITYSRKYLIVVDEVGNNLTLEGWFIGWDYSHCRDYHGSYNSEKDYPQYIKNLKKWTTCEIQQEVKEVCRQLNYNRGETK